VTVRCIERKSLLYRSKVEYGGWTINHVQGCSHGCRYPCYAMMLAKRTGRIASREEWLQPRLVSNAPELLDRELQRFRDAVDSVHLCFTTDPFMYDMEAGAPHQAVCELTVELLQRLSHAGIPSSTLTKGVYPVARLQDCALHPLNRYGISLVSLSESFREMWEPGAAPIHDRIDSLAALSDLGLRTWVSLEPYPTPNIDPSAANVESLLDAVAFADTFILGRWNYNALATSYDREHGFYAEVVTRVRAWCGARGKTLYVKKGTPLAGEVSSWSLSAV